MRRRLLVVVLGLCLFAGLSMAAACRPDPLDLPVPDPQPVRPLP